MGRGVPIENPSLVHPVIYFSFLAASFAASMAIITSICGVGFRRKSSLSLPSPSLSDLSSSPLPPPPYSLSHPIELGKDLDATPPSETENNNNNNENDEGQVKELPLPPAMAALQLPKGPFISEKMKRVTSERRMPLSLSIKMPRSLSVAKHRDHKEEKHKGNIGGKLKAEDSVWMKTIILGDKCVPDEEDDPVLYEGKGKRIEAYHTKKQSVMSMSAQTSFLDHDAVSLSVAQTKTQTQDEKNN